MSITIRQDNPVDYQRFNVALDEWQQAELDRYWEEGQKESEQMSQSTVYCGDALETLKTLPEGSVQCCITSPPYFALRSYMPDWIVLKDDVPDWVIQELETIGVRARCK